VNFWGTLVCLDSFRGKAEGEARLTNCQAGRAPPDSTIGPIRDASALLQVRLRSLTLRPSLDARSSAL
jgi:hypothetical protein